MHRLGLEDIGWRRGEAICESREHGRHRMLSLDSTGPLRHWYCPWTGAVYHMLPSDGTPYCPGGPVAHVL